MDVERELIEFIEDEGKALQQAVARQHLPRWPRWEGSRKGSRKSALSQGF
jgi:hypothetical protein